jgi:hypothetical protein
LAYPVAGQGSLSNQVLRLLARSNEWTAIQTYDKDTGHVKLERQSGAIADRVDKLENIGGNLYFNGVLLPGASGAGTVTSVALTTPSFLTTSGSPITSSGTFTVTLATQTANTVFAGPTGGAPAAPTFRALDPLDIPNIDASKITTGILAVARGGTGIASGTSGGVLGFTASGTIASSAALTANALVLGGGAGATPTVLGSLGTTTTVLHGNASGAPTFGSVALASDVSGVLPVANGGTGLSSGTSGGVLAFTASGTIVSSAALTANRIVLGGGAGAAPTILGSLGTTTTVLHGNAGGAPSFGAVSLTADVSGTLPVTSGGTGLTTVAQGDLLYGSASNTLSALAKSASATRYLANTGASNNPAWDQVNLANGVTGTLPAANGGTSITATPTNGQLLIGNGSGYTLATLTGTANQVNVTNGAGSITLSLPQSIATSSTPQFARLGLGTGAGSSALITGVGQFDLGFTDNGSCGTSDTIDWNAGETQKSTLSATTCTYTFSNPIAGRTYLLLVIQDATGGRLVTWPGTIVWEGNLTPILSETPSATDLCYFTWTGAAYQGRCHVYDEYRWITPTYSAGHFTGSGSITWSVDEGDVRTYAARRVKNTMTVVFSIVTSSVTGSGTQLRLDIPGTRTAAKYTVNPVYILDNGNREVGFAHVNISSGNIFIELVDSTTWAAASDTTEVYGEITFELN